MSSGTSVTFNKWFARGWLGAGFVFLYVPIVALLMPAFPEPRPGIC